MNIYKRIFSLLLCLLMLIPLSAGMASAEASDEEKENVALGKIVDTSSGTGAEYIVDGDLGTYWDSTFGRTTEHSTVIVDLLSWYKLDDVTVITYFKDSRYYQYKVEVSADGVNYTLIGEKNDKYVGSIKGKTFPCIEDSVRYIRVTMLEGSAGDEYHICEISARGVLDPSITEIKITSDPSDPDNIAVGKPTRANYNSVISSRVTDANIENSWNGNLFPQYVDVDLMDNYNISEIIVYMPVTDSYTFTIYGSKNGVNFDRIAESNEPKKGSADGEKFVFETPVDYRVLRVNVTSASAGGKASVCEIKVHGTKNDSQVTPTREKMEFTSYDEWLLENHGVDTSAIKDSNGNYDIEDTYTESDTVNALHGLVTRVLGSEYVNWFEFDVAENTDNDYDYFELSGGGDKKVKISGNDGVAIASGLNHYLKYYCRVNVSQQTKQTAMPSSAPAVGDIVRKETVCEVRYAYNYCTLSYTMQFYGFDDWQRELDYLMLQGVNVILDTTASEALWVMYLQQYGYTASEALDFVSGYGFKAWWLMGNLENFAGNVGDQWVYDTLEMARVNQRYMTVMGCSPCLNIFAGTLPANFKNQANETLASMGYPNVGDYMTGTGLWAGFARPHSLNSTFPGFAQMSRDFYETQNHLYGQITDYYAGDFLHEIERGFQLDPSFNKANLSRTVLDLLLEENDECCWIMQSWWENPLPDVVEGFGEDREDHVLMLDLAAANSARWTNTINYGGYEFGGSGWVFCMLDNYGGRNGMHGDFDHVMDGLLTAYENAEHFKGIGITPEGTEENPASYDFFWELIWFDMDDLPDSKSKEKFINDYVDNWLTEYAKRRYGTDSASVVKAWQILGDSVYGIKTGDGTMTTFLVTNFYPDLVTADGTSQVYADAYYRIPYDEEKLEEALALLMSEFDNLKDKETYIYDLCDIMCQLLTNSATSYFDKMAAEFLEGDYDTFHAYMVKFVRTLELIDEVTSYETDTMLGNWVGRIDDWVNDERIGEYSDYDIDTMKQNALILITTWASHDSLVGYANREYSGLINDYYLKMWKDFLFRTDKLLKDGSKTDAEIDRNEYFRYAWDLIISGAKDYPRDALPAAGDSEKGIRSLSEIYAEILQNHLVNSDAGVNKITVSEGYEYEISDGILNGIYGETKVADLIAALDWNNGSIKVLSAELSELSDNDTVSKDCVVVLTDIYGFETDSLKIGDIAEPSDASAPSSPVAPTADESSSPALIIIIIIAVVAIAVIAVVIIKKKK